MPQRTFPESLPPSPPTTSKLQTNPLPSSVQEYQTSELRKYFKEDALLYPLETIIGKQSCMNNSPLHYDDSNLSINREDIIEGFRLLLRQWKLPEGSGHLGEVRGGAPGP